MSRIDDFTNYCLYFDELCKNLKTEELRKLKDIIIYHLNKRGD